MKKIYLFGYLAALTMLSASCSQQLQRRYDQRHGTSTSSSRNYGNDRSDNSDYRSSNGTYRKDYDKVTDPGSRTESTFAGSPGSADYNQQMLAQYQEMDKLGEVVLYELDNLENRYNVLIGEYRSAKSSQKGLLADQLDKISEDQLILYRAYTNIYRNGKSNWTVVKRDVENDLRSVRRAADR